MVEVLKKGILLAGFFLSAVSAEIVAGNVTGNLPSSANIMPNCQFVGENITLAFGSYDPVVSNVTKNQDAKTSFSMRCVKGTTTTIGISDGQNAQGGTRRMRGIRNDYLRYELYSSASYSAPWDMNSTVSYAANNPQPKSFSIYGRIPAGQDVSSGAYSDTVTLSVTF